MKSNQITSSRFTSSWRRSVARQFHTTEASRHTTTRPSTREKPDSSALRVGVASAKSTAKSTRAPSSSDTELILTSGTATRPDEELTGVLISFSQAWLRTRDQRTLTPNDKQQTASTHNGRTNETPTGGASANSSTFQVTLLAKAPLPSVFYSCDLRR